LARTTSLPWLIPSLHFGPSYLRDFGNHCTLSADSVLDYERTTHSCGKAQSTARKAMEIATGATLDSYIWKLLDLKRAKDEPDHKIVSLAQMSFSYPNDVPKNNQICLSQAA
jgi:hypothetical protein